MLERVRFLSISASNLDEFYMVRAAGIYGQIAAGVTHADAGRSDAQAAAGRDQPLRRQAGRRQADLLERLKTDMAAAGMRIVEPGDLSASERPGSQRLFMIARVPDPDADRRRSRRIRFPFILNKGLTIAVWMQRKSDAKTMSGLIPIPGQLERFIRLRANESAKDAAASFSSSR